jgi:hypothetical protein
VVLQPGQNTSSHGVSASIAARIVGDHSMSRPAAGLLVPEVDHGLGVSPRRPVVGPALGTGLDVELPRPNPNDGAHPPYAPSSMPPCRWGNVSV